MADFPIKIGQFDSIPNFPLQFKSSKFDMLSTVTTPIELLSNDGKESCISHATGFFWNREKKSYLVTNWHVVTGKNPFTKKLMSKEGFIPTKMRFFGTESNQVGDDYHSLERKPFIVDLNEKKLVCKQHRDFDALSIDIAVIEIENEAISKGRMGGYLNAYGFEELFHPTGSDVFILGYPLRNYTGTMIPIWKRGSFATEPLIPVDNKPMFVVDAATMEGMSGAPIIRRVFGPACNENMSVNLKSIVTSQFIGIYAGRLKSKDMLSTNLGYAWYGNLIDQIIIDGVSL